MTRFPFNIRGKGLLQEDSEGEEFATLQLANEEAVRSAREIVGIRVLAGQSVSGAFEITDDAGNIVSTLSLKSVISYD